LRRFLACEVSLRHKGRLPVVSRKGYRYAAHPKPVPAHLKLVRTIPIRKRTDGLLQTADRAVRLLAKKAGHPLGTVPGASKSGSGSSSDTLIIAIAAGAGALLVAGLGLLRRRRRQRPTAEPESVSPS